MAGPLSALTVEEPTLAQLAGQAEHIVRVRVVDIRGKWESSAGGQRVIHTYVTCRVVKTLKGASAGTVTLRLLGGSVGDSRMVVPDMPGFFVGEESVIFVAGNGETFCPIVGAKYGRYRIIRDAGGGDWVERPDGGGAVRENDFEKAIAGRLGEKR